jgi:hypothetical protein
VVPLINKTYLNSISQIQNKLKTQKTLPAITLHEFINSKAYNDLKKKVAKSHLTSDKCILTHSYSKADISLPREIQDFILTITGGKIKWCQLRSFSHRDYEILSDLEDAESRYEIIIDLTDNWDASCGGTISYGNGQGESISTPTSKNTISLIKKKGTFQRFVKYVNNKAQRRQRMFVIIAIS